jgi:hypothetical protein
VEARNMATITLSVPDRLKREMERTDWINWSSVARHAFFETLQDLRELRMMRKVHEISEIPVNDTREIKESLAKDVVRSVESAKKSGRLKYMTLRQLSEFMGLK